jgi:hypothetical protein
MISLFSELNELSPGARPCCTTMATCEESLLDCLATTALDCENGSPFNCFVTTLAEGEEG